MSPLSVVESYGDLRRIGSRIVTTREAAARLGLSVSGASHQLRALEKSGLVRSLRRGLWALDPNIDPQATPHYLTSPYPAYVSLWTAMAHHDMIEQIPRQIHVASLARSQRIATSLGTYSVHHVAPEVFDGFDGDDESGYMATPEKALFDTVYIRASRGHPTHLPEVELPREFTSANLYAWCEKLKTARLRTLVSRALGRALEQAARA